MREVTVRIKFTKHCLGSVKRDDRTGKFYLPRDPNGSVVFLSTWHAANMRFAAKVFGRHQDEVSKIHWDIAVDGIVREGRDGWYRRYYIVNGAAKERYALHEAFVPGQIVGINCVVPSTITDGDFWQLMEIAGRYRGLSPSKPGEYGHFEVVSIRPRRTQAEERDTSAGEKQNPSIEAQTLPTG